MPQMFDDVGEIVEEALRRVGKRVVLALPLGIGKPNLIANEFFRRARGDATLDLTIFTALSLRKPTGSSALEKAFIEPLAARVFGNYPDLDYLSAMRRNDVPANVRVIEFFFEPGSLLNSAHAQSHYLCANYTHVARELLARGVNVIAHVVAKRVVGGNTEISLGSNPDVTVDLLPEVAKLRAAGTPVVMLGQVHREMPFMLGAANLRADNFDLLLDHSRYDYDLFAPPNPSLSTVDHAIGLHASSLVRDGGTLADRHRRARRLDRVFAAAASPAERSLAARAHRRGHGAQRGAGRCRRRPRAVRHRPVRRHRNVRRPDARPVPRRHPAPPRVRLSTAAARAGRERLESRASMKPCSKPCSPRAPARVLGATRRRGAQGRRRPAQRNALRQRQHRLARRRAHRGEPRQRQGARRAGARVPGPQPAGRHGHARRASCSARALSMPRCAHCRRTERRLFDMRGVGYINQLYGDDQALRVAQRSHARFVNTTMMLTTLGAAVSDGLADGRVVSGVGGQYNFVAMAHALPGARSVLCVRSTRRKDGKLSSNIVDELRAHHHSAPPARHRHHRIRHRRSARPHRRASAWPPCSNIADSRFQDALLAEAKRANKIDAGYRIPEEYRRNTPERLEEAFAAQRRAGPVLRVSVRHRSHARGNRTGARAALAEGKHRRQPARPRIDAGARAVRAAARDAKRAYLARLQLDAPA